jgi:hypothetical protein
MRTFLKPMRCPECGKPINPAHLKNGVCPHCSTNIRIAASYLLITDFLIFNLIFLVAALNYRSTVGGVWLLKICLLVVPLSVLRLWFVQPWLAKGSAEAQKFRLTFIGAYFTAIMLGVGYALACAGWLHVILRARPDELTNHLHLISEPVVNINPNFLITRERSFAEVLGILLANSWFYAIIIFGCYSLAQPFLRRGRVTQIGISSNVIDDDD